LLVVQVLLFLVEEEEGLVLLDLLQEDKARLVEMVYHPQLQVLQLQELEVEVVQDMMVAVPLVVLVEAVLVVEKIQVL
jgi:hypothetical protein